LSLACHKGVETEGEPPPIEPVPAPTPEISSTSSAEGDLSVLVKALSQRDGAPDCAKVEALVATPVLAMLQVVETVHMPPMAPMRAASCLMDGHAADPAVATAVISWMSKPETLGLALLVAERIDALPAELARQAATQGLAGPHAAKLRERLVQSQNPEIKALLAP
jgi:hypothetical protein